MNIFANRPFKTRNAEDFDLAQILDVFVNPMNDTRSPFDFENTIIKGEMGSGKSIFLKANYAYYLYSIVPSLLSKESVVLPVQIRLSDHQHLQEPNEIYNSIIISVIKGISRIYSELESAERLLKIHTGMQSLPRSIFNASQLAEVLEGLVEMEAAEYKQIISKELGYTAKVKPRFMELGSQFKENGVKQVTGKKNPSIGDVHDAYERLLGDFNGSILLLIDEAGSLGKKFFKTDSGTSLFETLMNQFRTAEYIRTKIAVYPHSYSDILVETRYGEMTHLTESVIDQIGYNRFRERSIGIIDRYIGVASKGAKQVLDVFDINPSPTASGDSLEQIIYASKGNVRRLLSILDSCMHEAYFDHHGKGKIEANHVVAGIIKHSSSVESIFNSNDRDFLEILARTCRSRSTYRFKFPQKAPVLAKYLSKSEEHNLISIVEAGSGRRGTTYEFDYAFCIHHNIPTHYVKNTERIDKERSMSSGQWISRITSISEEIIEHAQIPGKIEGEIKHVCNDVAFAITDSGEEYFLLRKDTIEADKDKNFLLGKRVRFYPIKYEDSNLAYSIEVL